MKEMHHAGEIQSRNSFPSAEANLDPQQIKIEDPGEGSKEQGREKDHAAD